MAGNKRSCCNRFCCFSSSASDEEGQDHPASVRPRSSPSAIVNTTGPPKRSEGPIPGSSNVVTPRKDEVEQHADPNLDVFRVEGCGPMFKNEAVLKDDEGNSILALKRKLGLVEVLCFRTQWKGFVKDEIIDEHQKPIFKVIASAVSCCQKDDPIKVSLTNSEKNKRGWDYNVVGSFTERDCGIYDHSGAIAAEVFVNTAFTDSKDIYSVAVGAGVDQAFVFGVIAILDKLSEEDHGYPQY